MNQVTITFERIFDVVRIPKSDDYDAETLFSFESGAVRKFGIRVPGWPALRDGMIVTAILKKPNNWQTLIGWIDNSTGEIVCRNQGSASGALIFGAIFVFLACLSIAKGYSPWLVACWVLLAVVGFVFAAYSGNDVAKAKQLLNETMTRVSGGVGEGLL